MRTEIKDLLKALFYGICHVMCLIMLIVESNNSDIGSCIFWGVLLLSFKLEFLFDYYFKKKE